MCVYVVRRSSLCLRPRGQSIASATKQQRAVRKTLRNEFLSFSYDMPGGGLQELSVFVQCQGRSSRIHMGKFREVYKITHYSGPGHSNTVCLRLHRNIEYMESTFNFNCRKFYINFQGLAKFKKLCVSNIFYLGNSDVGQSHACGKSMTISGIVSNLIMSQCVL